MLVTVLEVNMARVNANETLFKPDTLHFLKTVYRIAPCTAANLYVTGEHFIINKW